MAPRPTRPSWLDGRISFIGDNRDTPARCDAPVLVNILCGRDVELNFAARRYPDPGTWAYIDNIAACYGGKQWSKLAPFDRGNWSTYAFKTTADALLFAQRSLLFVVALHRDDVGLLPAPKADPRLPAYAEAEELCIQLESIGRTGQTHQPSVQEGGRG